MPFYMGEILIDGIDVGMGETFLEQIDALESENAQLSENVDTLTQEKSSLESEVSILENEAASLNTEIIEGKEVVANAITEKGVTTATDATFEVLATNISNIPTGLTLIYTATHIYGRNNQTINIGCYPDLVYVKKVRNDDSSIVNYAVWIKAAVGTELGNDYNVWNNSNGWFVSNDYFLVYRNPIQEDGTVTFTNNTYAGNSYYFDYYFYA